MQNKNSPTGSEVTSGGSVNYDLINDIDVNVFDDNNILVRGQCVRGHTYCSRAQT